MQQSRQLRKALFEIGFFVKKREIFTAEALTGKLGLFAMFVLSLLPVLFWALYQPLGARFGDLSSALTSIGQVTGLVGITMMSLAMILSSRPVFLDRFFNGLNNLYRAHRNFGIASFLLILVHPLTLAASYIPFSGNSAALFLLPSSDWPRNFGIIALAGMMLVIAITVLANKIKYQALKAWHKLFGAVFLFSALHTALVKSDISQNQVLHWYIFSLMALGLSAFTYKSLLDRFLVAKYVYFIKKARMLPAKTVEITMSPMGKPMRYYPGQFIFISFFGPGISSEPHPFSISSSPRDEDLKILVKALGDFTSKMASFPAGTRAAVEGPFGKLIYYKTINKNQLWIAGGSGIAPFIGMARDLKKTGQGYNIDLYYCAPSKKDLVCLQELSQISLMPGSFRLVPFCQNRNGFLDAEKIQKISGGLQQRDIFLCGPPPMVRSLKKQFAKLQIPKYKIHSEEFSLL